MSRDIYIEEIRDISVDFYGDVRTLVRGLPYQCPEDWEEVLQSLDEDSKLYLVKEPDNPKDELAIAAYLDDRRVGYVAADDNCKIWMFLTDEKTPCKVIQKYEASFKVSFENPKRLFENMDFEELYKDKEGWIEKNLPIMEVPFLVDKEDDNYEWYRENIIIKDFEEFIPDFRRKLAAKMIMFVARKNSQGNYRYYLPYINAAVAVVEDDMIKNFIDKDGFVIAIPDLSKKTYPGGILIYLNVARIQKESSLITKFREIEKLGNNELVFYLNSNPNDVLAEEGRSTNRVNSKTRERVNVKDESAVGEFSQSLFDQIDKLTSDIDDFVKDTLLKSRRVLKQLHKHPHYGYRYDNLKDYEGFAKIFVMKDLCNVFKELKGSYSIYDNEGKILFMYALKAIGDNSSVSFDVFKEMCNPSTSIDTIIKYRKLIENFIKQQVDEKLPYYPQNDFLMHEVLEDENLELMDMACEYIELINRFAKAVAKAKGKISPKGQKWLSQLAARV